MNRQSAKRRAAQPAYDEAKAELRDESGGVCEMCGRHYATEPHHVAGRGKLLTDKRFLLDLDRDCHRAIERMSGEDGAALALVLLRNSGRCTPEDFYRAIGSHWPDESHIERWANILSYQARRYLA